jgi:hypothetical protein
LPLKSAEESPLVCAAEEGAGGWAGGLMPRGNFRGNFQNNMTKTRGSNNYYRSDNYHKKNEDFGNNFQKTNYDFK